MPEPNRPPFVGDVRFMSEFEEGQPVVIAGNKYIVDQVIVDSRGSIQVTILTVDAYLDKYDYKRRK